MEAEAGGGGEEKDRKPVIFAMPKPKAADKVSAQVHVIFNFLLFFYFFHKRKAADKVSAQVHVLFPYQGLGR